ncbi:MAG: hypothetical protein [Wendovervirus sonii]|uniref:Uncharacterized protein n=1 Tax=phage Lak_Megaphage_Sonny TaxID=3109229 RepID=A0ABZ0Z6I6_9CAUD|nr:MAG: hypothetical protein [phage Lak_Megaphage_Sonny]
MARYFQHIDSDDTDFQKITELELIDNSDPNSVMFYFKDGSKCFKQYIADINSDIDIYGKMAFVELTSPNNKWQFRNIKMDIDEQYGFHNNIKYKIEDPYMIGHENEIGKSISRVSKIPTKVPNFKPEPDEKYYLINENGEMSIPTIEEDPIKEHMNTYSSDTHVIDEAASVDIAENVTAPVLIDDTQKEWVSDIYNINADDLIAKGFKTISFHYNGIDYTMKADDFFNNAIIKPEEKIVEKEVIKEVIVNKEEHLEIKLDDTQKNLIDNMIDMSQKDKCDIEMSITLSLPPVSVYKIIKQVYPEGMSKAFVNIIADRMQILELKSAVAAGLLDYYDESENIEVKTDDK